MELLMFASMDQNNRKRDWGRHSNDTDDGTKYISNVSSYTTRSKYEIEKPDMYSNSPNNWRLAAPLQFIGKSMRPLHIEENANEATSR